MLAAAYSNGTVAIVLTTSDDGHVTVTHLDTANKGTVVDSVSGLTSCSCVCVCVMMMSPLCIAHMGSDI